MRRYYPSGHERGPTHTDGIRRIGIAEWHALWRDDPAGWLREIRDRPKRFDNKHWQRAVRLWRNDTPRKRDWEEGSPPLDGVPILVKDLYDVPGERTTCSSAVFLDAEGTDAPVASTAGPFVEALCRVGASIEGRTHMNEFAYGLDGRNRFTGDCPHPFANRRISGGSSSGSAWAVAAGVVPVALGTDTGGSIRLPAALCGIYGVRLGWSAARLRGVFPLAASMDTVGWFTHSIDDMQAMLAAVASVSTNEGDSDANAFTFAPGDSVRIDDDKGTAAVPHSDGGAGRHWRIGLVLPPGVELTAEMTAIWQEVKRRMSEAGVTITEETAPDFLGDPAVDAYNVIGSSEAWSVHRELIPRHGELYDPIVRGLIERGKHWSAFRRNDAEATREDVRGYAKTLFERYDAVLLPATTIPSPTFDEADGAFRSQILRLNTLGSLAGLPALSLPIHRDAVRSGGVQVLFPSGREDRFSGFLSVWRGIV